MNVEDKEYFDREKRASNELCGDSLEDLAKLSLAAHELQASTQNLQEQLTIDLTEAQNYIAETNRRLTHNANQIPELKETRCSENLKFIQDLLKCKGTLSEIQEIRGSLSDMYKSPVLLQKAEKLLQKDLMKAENDIEILLDNLESKVTQEISLLETKEIQMANDFVKWQTELEKESGQMLDEIERKNSSISKIRRDLQTSSDFLSQYKSLLWSLASASDSQSAACEVSSTYSTEESKSLQLIEEALEESLYIFETQFTELSQYVRDKFRPDISKHQVSLDNS